MDTFIEFRCIRRVSQKRFHNSTSRFPPLAPTGSCSPASSVLSRRYDALPPFRRTSFPSLGGTSVALVVSLPGGRVNREGLELVTRCLQPGIAEERTGFSQVLGEPQLSVCTCSKPTPAGLLTPDRCGAAAWPLVIERQRLPREGLSTLNSMAFGLAVYASQCRLLQHHARLASSCWSGSTGRAFHPQGSAERFQSCKLHLIPLSQASWRNRCDRRALAGLRSLRGNGRF